MKLLFQCVSAVLLGGALLVGGGGGAGCEGSGAKSKGDKGAKEGAAVADKAGMTKADFGQTEDGRKVDLYTLTNKNGVVAKVMTFGAILTELHVPDKSGKKADVVLGFSTLDKYLKGHPFFGATTGRFANRIAKGRFTLDGKEYKLAANNGPNHLHGGNKGFDKV